MYFNTPRKVISHVGSFLHVIQSAKSCLCGRQILQGSRAVCTVLVVPDPEETTKEEWVETMFPALSGEDYVSGRYSARVYGLNQLAPYANIVDGFEAAVLVSTECDTAIETAEAVSGDLGVKLMVRLGMGSSVALQSFDEKLTDHGILPKNRGRKHALYCLRIDPDYNLNFITDLIRAGIPNGESMVRVFREDGGKFLDGVQDCSFLSRLLGLEESDQYMIKATVENHEQGLSDLALLRQIKGVQTPIAFIQV